MVNNIKPAVQILEELYTSKESYTVKQISNKIVFSYSKTKKLINYLKKKNLVEKVGTQDSSIGRNPGLYGLSDSHHYWLGIDLEIPELQLGLYDIHNRLISHSKQVLQISKITSPKSLQKELRSYIHRFFRSERITKNSLLGCGIGVSGVVFDGSFDAFSRPIPGNTYPLKQSIEDYLGAPTVMGNDIDMELISELWQRNLLKSGNKTAVCFTARRSVLEDKHIRLGGSIFGNGKILEGSKGTTGNFGHAPVPQLDLKLESEPKCGNPSCLECYINEKYELSRKKPPPEAVKKILIKRIETLIFFFNPNLLLLDFSALPNLMETVVKEVRNTFNELNIADERKELEISSIKDSTLACARGAVIRSKEDMFQNPENYEIFSGLI